MDNGKKVEFVERRTMLVASDVAERLGFHARTILAMANRGDFAGVALRIGRSWRFDAAKLDEWIEARRS